MADFTNQDQSANDAAQREALNVLVVDDDDSDRDLTLLHLGKAWPFEREMATDTATDGHEALERIRTKRFALIVLDWKLPGLGGCDILRALRGTEVRIPVVVLSGSRRHEIDENLEMLGAAFLNKNEMNSETFRTAIAESLRMLGLNQPVPAA